MEEPTLLTGRLEYCRWKDGQDTHDEGPVGAANTHLKGNKSLIRIESQRDKAVTDQ